ncbi:O-methyltransferase-domain-containing protein [Dendryphion nanum]|uniref:O-methyltransferase-domain-containing protein n=1 Tax=Dendryphion nanum TaxID=256645 RepID=A0A9P9IB81_9PLEO|nr:O-methyltransferase-domain-containing protein [Dendryphion nanum]
MAQTTPQAGTDPLQLAISILSSTNSLINHLSSISHPVPSFSSTSSPPPSSKEYETLRIAINNSALDLLRLVNGPAVSFRTQFCTHYDLAAYQVALEFDFFTHVPLTGSLSTAALAEKVGIEDDKVSRTMKFMATQRVFKEIVLEDGTEAWEHTAASATLARSSDLRDASLMQMDEMFRAASETSTIVRSDPFKGDSIHSPFHAKHGLTAYEYYAKFPEKGGRFARAMAGVTSLDRQTSELRDEYTWGSLTSGSIVDVGGGSGHISISLAREFPHLNFIVQDISPIMLAQGQALLTPDVKGRITFMQHDFFSEQPVAPAAAFFVRQITHNWNDDQCVKLLQSFVPALEKSAPRTPLLINDTVLPDIGEKTAYEEYGLRQLDIAMFVVLGAKQRSEREFRRLLETADKRLRLVKIHSKGSMGLLEIHLER